jgi:PadR family transcriptional regulator AphA
MSAWPALSLPEWTVLAVVNEGPTHGFAIAQLTIPTGELGRIWQIPRPVIYRSIGRLLDLALLAPSSVESGRGPQRTLYSVTPQGAAAVAHWLDTPVQHIREVRSHLLLKLALLDRAGSDPTGLLIRQKEILEPIAEAIKAESPGPAGFDATLLAWRRATTAATMSFLDDLTQATPAAEIPANSGIQAE